MSINPVNVPSVMTIPNDQLLSIILASRAPLLQYLVICPCSSRHNNINKDDDDDDVLPLGALKKAMTGKVVNLKDVIDSSRFGLSLVASFDIVAYKFKTTIDATTGFVGIETQLVILTKSLGARLRFPSCFKHHPTQGNNHCNCCMNSYEMIKSCGSKILEEAWLFHQPSTLTRLWQIFRTIKRDSLSLLHHSRSILLLGDSGSGLSTLIYSIADRLTLPIVEINAALLFGNGNGLSPDLVLARAFRLAVSMQPCVLLIDDVESIFPAKLNNDSDVLQDQFGKVAAVFQRYLALFDPRTDQNHSFQNVLVVCKGMLTSGFQASDIQSSTNHISSLVTNMIGEVIGIPHPGVIDRRRIIEYIARSFLHEVQPYGLSSESVAREKAIQLVDIKGWADQLTAKPVISLAKVIRTELNRLVEGQASGQNGGIRDPSGNIGALSQCIRRFIDLVSSSHGVFDTSLDYSPPILSVPVLPNIELAGSEIEFPGIYGHQSLRKILSELILWPRKYPHIYKSLRLLPELGLLLYGPPGTGKTMLPGALARALKCKLVDIKLSSVVKGTIGEGEKRIRDVFCEARKAAPSIIFIDEFQAIFTSRDHDDRSVGLSLTSALSTCFDDVATWNKFGSFDSQIFVLAATNEPWAVDEGFLRPGRLGKQLFVGPLDLQGRTELLIDWYYKLKSNCELLENANSLLQSIPVTKPIIQPAEVDWISEVACACEGYTAADLHLVINKVCMKSYAEMQLLPTALYFEEVLREMTPSVSIEEWYEYENWRTRKE